MTGAPEPDITALLHAWRTGDRAALDRLTAFVYPELHRLAHHYLAKEGPGHTLQTSALVNEAYLRLLRANRVNWQDRAHFIAVCARIMRRILVEHARSRKARKRGGTTIRVEFSDRTVFAPERDADLIALDEALEHLARADPREAQVVELRFFGGLNEEETARVLSISERTVRREWDHARVWLIREIQRGARP